MNTDLQQISTAYTIKNDKGTELEVKELTFDSYKIRVAWCRDEEKFYFSIVDCVGLLTEQVDFEHARNYWKVLKHRISNEGNESVTNCNQLKLRASDGKHYRTDVADAARQNLEHRLGRSVLSKNRAINFTTPADELPLPKSEEDMEGFEEELLSDPLSKI